MQRSRRDFLCAAGGAALTLTPMSAFADALVKLPLPGGPDERELTTAFPQKGRLILQRTRPPLLETPMEVFDRSIFTPNDQFYVRWHWSGIPNEIDANSFRLSVHGHVERPLSLSLDDLLALPQMELAAVNQCSGNSRGYFQPRVSGAQWSHGAMGNARWTGVSLKAVLDRAGRRNERIGFVQHNGARADAFQQLLPAQRRPAGVEGNVDCSQAQGGIDGDNRIDRTLQEHADPIARTYPSLAQAPCCGANAPCQLPVCHSLLVVHDRQPVGVTLGSIQKRRS
jgi:DMSO/TMAO reductase YedYZ molybdopterin-dependent catalytic subunit